MKLTVLGSGTCVPSLKRNAPGYLVEANDTNILLDCGSGTLLQLEKRGKSYRDIDLVVITHTHPDHCSDLIPYVQALLVTPPKHRKKAINIAGPPGFIDFFRKALSLHMSLPESLPLQVIELVNPFPFRGLTIIPSKINHTHNSAAYRIVYQGKSLVFSGDCDYDETLVTLSKETDLLVIECSYPDAMKREGHLTASECGEIAKKAAVKKVLLTHFYPSPNGDVLRKKECKAVYKGEVLMAKDLMEIDLTS